MANGLDDGEGLEDEPRLERRSGRRHQSVSGSVHTGLPEAFVGSSSSHAGTGATLGVLGAVTVVGVLGATVGLLTVDAGSRTATACYAIAIVAGLLTFVAVAAAVNARRRHQLDVAIVVARIEALVAMARTHPDRDWGNVIGREMALAEDAFALALDTGVSVEAERLAHALAGLREIETRR